MIRTAGKEGGNNHANEGSTEAGERDSELIARRAFKSATYVASREVDILKTKNRGQSTNKRMEQKYDGSRDRKGAVNLGILEVTEFARNRV